MDIEKVNAISVKYQRDHWRLKYFNIMDEYVTLVGASKSEIVPLQASVQTLKTACEDHISTINRMAEDQLQLAIKVKHLERENLQLTKVKTNAKPTTTKPKSK